MLQEQKNYLHSETHKKSNDIIENFQRNTAEIANKHGYKVKINPIPKNTDKLVRKEIIARF